jgi:hypothetical protein
MESELIPDRQCELVSNRCVGRKLGAQTLRCLIRSGESRAISSRCRLTPGLARPDESVTVGSFRSL